MQKQQTQQADSQWVATLIKRPMPSTLFQPSPVAKLVLAEVHDE
jgi:hypothetical protein